ncbi:hypothetical protein [Caulobacter sp. DWP3-1-3b2]|uniref:hypothetical protein n=1 Tax=Caulobacter sp. DWP3-1-3b2 TaxID=2804643 RepID=UPI003CF45825
MDLRIKHPCPFCGEREHLTIQEGGAIQPLIINGATTTDESGCEVVEEVDGVWCEACWAAAPLTVWLREIPPERLAVLRDFDPPANATVLA